MAIAAALPALISAGSQIAGGIMNRNASNRAQRMNMIMEAQRQADNERLQKEFAQSGIQWKVEDAKKAGVHPLYALGASTHSFSPSQVGMTFQPDHSMGNAVANMGQDISRAIDSTRSESQRVNAYTETAQKLTLQKMGLENELLGAQIAKIRQNSNPPFPVGDRRLIDGQGNSKLIKDTPLERINADPKALYAEPGPVTDVGYVRTKDGYMPVMSKDAKERLEEDWPGMLSWNLRNRLMPTFGANETPPRFDDPGPGKEWMYDPFKQQYQRVPKRWLNLSPWR